MKGLLAAVALLFLLALAGNADTTGSSELGYTSLSPRGATFGEIVPASCESGFEHWMGGMCSCVPYYGQGCTSSANACGQVTWGAYQCNGTCATNLNPIYLYEHAGYGGAAYGVTRASSLNSGIPWAAASSLILNGASYATLCSYFAYDGQIPGDCSGIWWNDSWFPDNAFPSGLNWNDGIYIVKDITYPTVSPPPNPSGYGSSCQSPPNACGQVSYGTIGCGTTSCVANADYYGPWQITGSPPADTCDGNIGYDAHGGNTGMQAPYTCPADVNKSCQDASWNCDWSSCATYIRQVSCVTGQTCTQTGAGQCSVTTPPANPPGYGNSCTSAPNSCGSTNPGTIQCDGSCSATTPANPPNYGQACTSSANACGQTNSGTIQCDGSCSATTPANPPGYGSACTSGANACGQTNSGTIQCNGTCSATTPSNPPGYGNICNSPANSCGSTNQGTIQCDGSCSAQYAPPDPPGYGSICLSDENSCGLRNLGTIQCSGLCSAGVPPVSACTESGCASLSANPETPGMGGSTTLSWSASCGTPISCVIYNENTGQIIASSTASSGSQLVGPITVITNYGLTCNHPGGGAYDEVTVYPSNARSGEFEEF